MRFERQAELQDAEAEQNNADRPDQAEDKVRETIDDGDRIVTVCICCRDKGNGQYKSTEDDKQVSDGFLFFFGSSSISSMSSYFSTIPKLKALVIGT